MFYEAVYGLAFNDQATLKFELGLEGGKSRR
jgi:hypothetical protein